MQTHLLGLSRAFGTMSVMIDSHCHLADRKFAVDRAEVLARARAAGVERMITIADSLEESERCIELAEKFAAVYCTVGVHPHNSSRWSPDVARKFNVLVRQHSKVRAIGEIGLDYHYDCSPRPVQQDVFRKQLAIAQEIGVPVVVHCREAREDVWTIVHEIKPEKLVLHCCTERWADVERFVECGYLLSFTGIATYPKSGDIRETIKRCPLERMMIETDAPYLAPVPHRGKRNEPAFVVEVAKTIAQVKGISLEEVDAATTQNAVDFFGLP